MTAEQLIEELRLMAPEERLKIRSFLDSVFDSEIPSSFWEGLAQADAGKVMDIDDSHFDNPPT